jgi:hypothetical protein
MLSVGCHQFEVSKDCLLGNDEETLMVCSIEVSLIRSRGLLSKFLDLRPIKAKTVDGV